MKQAVKKTGDKKAFSTAKTSVSTKTTKPSKAEHASTLCLQKPNLFRRFLEVNGDCV